MNRLISALALILGVSMLTPAWAEQSPMTVDGTTAIDVVAAKKLFDREVPFIDVRKNSDWEAGRVPGAHHLELKKQFTEAAMLKISGKGDEVVIYCNGSGCMRSSQACAKAVAWGFKKVHYFRDGFPAWKAANMPIE